MKPVLLLLSLLLFSPGLASCSTDEPAWLLPAERPSLPEVQPVPGEPDSGGGGTGSEGNDNHQPMSNQLKISIGVASFRVSLADNAAAKAFRALLPLTLDMSELNGNEKFYNLSAALPAASSRVATIRAGDLMLYGGNCLVLFYETFSSAFSYTRLGRVDDPAGLADALGAGRATVVFEPTDD